MNRLLALATALLALLLLAWSASTYSALPATIPVHFGPNGVDRFAAKSFQAWFTLPLLAVGLCVVNYGIAALIAPRPQLINIPRKKRLLALPKERQAIVMGWWWVLMQTIGIVEVLLLAIAQFGIWRAVAGGVNSGKTIAMLVSALAVAMVPISLAIIWRMTAEIERQESADA